MIFEIILTFILFFLIKALVFYFTDNRGLPEFLKYKPYICYKCCSFWTLLTIYSTIFYISNCNWWFMMIVGTLITVLDTVALTVDENNNIVTIDEI